MAGTLPGTPNLKDGVITNTKIVGGTRIDTTETVARAPSVYRALAVAGGNTYEEKVTIARATIGAKGSAVTGRLRIEAPVDTAYPVVQKFTGTDGVESKRVSTNESTWGNWRKLFDEVDKPNIATDVTGAGTLAQQNADDVSISKMVVSQTDSEKTVELNSTIEGLVNLLLTATHNGSNGAGLQMKLATASAASGDQMGRLYFDIGAGHMGAIIGELLSGTPSSYAARLTLQTTNTTATLITRAYVGLGIYTAGTTDNGADSITSITHYLKAAAAPSNPAVAGSWALYVDSGDGNKLKAKHSTGTVVTLGTP
jgi:hypothetical protein